MLIGSHRIWTHNIRGIDFHEDFQSESCPAGNGSAPQMAATIAAGETDADVYEALDEYGAIVVGGSNPVREYLYLYILRRKSNLCPF